MDIIGPEDVAKEIYSLLVKADVTHTEALYTLEIVRKYLDQSKVTELEYWPAISSLDPKGGE